MTQMSAHPLTDEDNQLVSKYRLGHILKVYKLTPRQLRSSYVFSLIEAIGYTLGSIVCLIMLMVLYPGWSLLLRVGVGLTFLFFATSIMRAATSSTVLSKGAILLSIVSIIVIVSLVQSPEWSLYLRLGVCLAFLAFAVGITRFTMLHSEQKTRLILCEAGFLKARKISNWHTRIQVIYWENVQKQKSYFLREKCWINHQSGETLIISASNYQDGHELITLIKEQIEKMESNR